MNITDEMLSKVDLSMLKKIIWFYSTSGEGATPAEGADVVPPISTAFLDANEKVDMSDNLELWAYNKSNLYELFGKTLKIEIPLNDIQVPIDCLTGKIDNTLNKIEKINPLIGMVFNKINNQTLLSNILPNSIRVLDVILPEGQKINKSLKLLEPDPVSLNKIQSLYSELLQASKTTGYLVLSIDPIDFITMSCSQSNWRSCHHPNREWGMGGMSYLCDNNTAIAYVKSKSDVEFDYGKYYGSPLDCKIKFPNKIWRQLVEFPSDLGYAIQMRQYPNINTGANNRLSELLVSLLAEYHKGDFVSEKCSVSDLRALCYYHEDEYDRNLYYNDVAEEAFSEGYLIHSKAFDRLNAIRNGKEIHPGENCYCACGCGETVDERDSAYICCSRYGSNVTSEELVKCEALRDGR